MCTTSPIAAAGAIVGSRPGRRLEHHAEDDAVLARLGGGVRRQQRGGQRQGQHRGCGGEARGGRAAIGKQGGGHRRLRDEGIEGVTLRTSRQGRFSRAAQGGARNGSSETGGVRPSSRSASASPSAAECLKPWPEQAETKVIASDSGCGRTRNEASAVLV